MGLPLHSYLRRKIKDGVDALLKFLFPMHLCYDPIPTESIHRILVIRLNYRIGNIVFTTPLLRALEKRFPQAKIDVLIGAAYPAPLIQGLPTVENVFDFPRKLLKNPLKTYRYIHQLRATHYDLVVNPNSGSASDRGATWLAKGTYKLGFETSTNWSPLTHAIEAPEGETHEALKPLKLMRAFGNQPTDFPQRMDIGLSGQERFDANRELKKRLSDQGFTPEDGGIIIGLFRDARFDKKIETLWWSVWYQAMKELYPHALFVDILSPDVKDTLSPEVCTLSEPNLRKLGGLLSQMDFFVCGDTGPMHLATASMVPTIALFKSSAPLLYGTLGEGNLSLVIGDYSPIEVAALLAKHLQEVLY
jgi:ADP-heptose:LPS heptosyltransferase